MRFWKRPAAVGETAAAQTLAPPADWPKSVTFPGSPPKRAMLRFTQRSAACWSCNP
jgi:hypothetical protein